MKTKWTKEMIQAEATKFKTRSLFSRYSNNAYNAAVRMKVLDDVCSHMPQRYLDKKIKSDKKVFIRYQNRKLYDATESKYVNLSQILKMPVGSFMVMDDKTKEDITNYVLIQGVTAILHENPESFEKIKQTLIAEKILVG